MAPLHAQHQTPPQYPPSLPFHRHLHPHRHLHHHRRRPPLPPLPFLMLHQLPLLPLLHHPLLVLVFVVRRSGHYVMPPSCLP